MCKVTDSKRVPKIHCMGTATAWAEQLHKQFYEPLPVHSVLISF